MISNPPAKRPVPFAGRAFSWSKSPWRKGWIRPRASRSLSLAFSLAVLPFLVPSARAVIRADLSLRLRDELSRMSTEDAAASQRAAALAHYATAQQLEQAGQMREALEHYIAVVRLDPSHAEVAQHAAELAYRYRGKDEAVALLEAAATARPTDFRPVMALIRFLSTYGAGDSTSKSRAQQLLLDLPKRFPQQAEVISFVVLQQLSQNRRTDAVQTLEKASSLAVADPAWWLALGRVAQEVWPLAQTELREEHTRRVNVFFERALKQSPTGSAGDAVKLDVAQYYVLTNQLEIAKVLCADLVAKTGNLQARKLLFRLLQADGAKDEALAELEKIVQAVPADVEQRRLLAQAYQEREEWAKAFPHLEAAIQIGGGDASDYQSLGQLLLQSQLYDRLIELCARTLQLFPDNPIFHIHQAFALRSLQRWDKAIAAMERAASLAETGQAELVNHRFYFQFGLILERGGKPEKAAQMFEKAITLTPKDEIEDASTTMNYLGYLWLDQGIHLDKAGELIRKANELQPGNPAYIDSLGWWYYKKGDYAHALIELERALSLMKSLEADDAEILEHIAQTHLKLGDKAKAREMFQRARDLGPSDPRVRQRIEKGLNELN